LVIDERPKVCAYIGALSEASLPRPALETNRGNVVARLEREGWMPRHGGDHDVYKHPSKPGRIVVARHRTLSIGVARIIAKTAGWAD
jgi:predicted RNA binding protein YcfA (HicA-like mRNA interferase family)